MKKIIDSFFSQISNSKGIIIDSKDPIVLENDYILEPIYKEIKNSHKAIIEGYIDTTLIYSDRTIIIPVIEKI